MGWRSFHQSTLNTHLLILFVKGLPPQLLPKSCVIVPEGNISGIHILMRCQGNRENVSNAKNEYEAPF